MRRRVLHAFLAARLQRSEISSAEAVLRMVFQAFLAAAWRLSVACMALLMFWCLPVLSALVLLAFEIEQVRASPLTLGISDPCQ